MEEELLFESMKPGKAFAKIALPTVASQVIILLYNLADTWFIGRRDDPNMIGASSLALTVFLALTALANVFGVGGGTLMVRLTGEKKKEDARKVASYTVAAATIAGLVFSALVFILMNPLLRLLGADEDTLGYARQYCMTTTVLGGVPIVLSMCMPQLLRNAGYSKEAGLGVGLGSAVNILLDPLLMFVLLPEGNEVLGAGIATGLSNWLSMFYFVLVFRRVQKNTVLSLPRKLEHLDKDMLRAFYSVGIPAAIAIFLFDLVTIVINRLTVDYGNTALAAMGVVLKLERIPIQVGLGFCLGMVPLAGYNYGAGNKPRMDVFVKMARFVLLGFSALCAVLFFLFAEPIVRGFIKDEETVRQGVEFLRGRCISLPFMMIGYHVVNYMNAVGRGKISFFLAIVRHLVLIIPILLLMNALWRLQGLIWAQVVADAINALFAFIIFFQTDGSIRQQLQQQEK